VARIDSQLFGALLSGEHTLHGFTNRDVREKLRATPVPLSDTPKTPSSQVSRLFHRLHVDGLVAKIPRSRRWRVSAAGYRVMSASLRLREIHFPALHADAARAA
jgi:DNA-binding IclR family transcriptional regulator